VLPEEVENWSTSESPVYLADIAKYYNCHPGGCPAGMGKMLPFAPEYTTRIWITVTDIVS
jgi:hypothetical protein